jgi:nucleoside phosphorylase
VILVVAATARELEHVNGAETLVCGIGPVEAALATAKRLTPGTVEGPVDAILHVGIAGAATLPTSTLVIGSEAVYCDVVDPASTIPRVERVDADQKLVERARRALPDALVLPIATAARVGGGIDCEVEAMEGFGVLRAAQLAAVPAVEVRAVSNAVAEADRTRWAIAAALAALAAALPPLLAELDA